jgi:hypothetical protein
MIASTCHNQREGSHHGYDIWESMEAFQSFGATLVPIIVEVGEPMAIEVPRLEQAAR